MDSEKKIGPGKLAGDFFLAISFTRFSYKWHLLLAAVFYLLSGAVVSYRNLDAAGCATIMERYAVFAGIFLFAPLLLPEQDREIWQIEKSKALSVFRLIWIRLLMAMLALLIVIGGFLLGMRWGNSRFDAGLLLGGAYAEILFVGSIAFFFSAVTNQIVIGYMMAVLYYVVNLGAAKYLWKFALFQMRGNSFDFIGWMLAGAAALLISGTLLREKCANL